MNINHLAVTPKLEELGTLVQENLFDLFRSMAAVLPGGELVEGPTLSFHHTFPTNPMFKGVWATRLTANDVEEVIDRTIAWFQARNAPFFFWWTGIDVTPADLGERLRAKGLLDMAEQQQHMASGIKQTEQGAPCMVADLQQMNEAVLERTPAGFIIEEITDERGLYDFKRVFVDTYEIPDSMGQGWVDATLAAGIGKTPWRVYVGYLDGKPVATNMLFNGAGVASVYAVATLPSARGKGIGAAITLKPLLVAREMGFRHAVLFSTEMGVRVYERIGFTVTNVRINRYLWRNPG